MIHYAQATSFAMLAICISKHSGRKSQRAEIIKNPPDCLTDLLLLTMFLLLPKLITCGFDLLHLTRDDKDGPFADVGHSVSKPFEVVRHPQKPVGALDGCGVLNDEGHQLAINLII